MKAKQLLLLLEEWAERLPCVAIPEARSISGVHADPVPGFYAQSAALASHKTFLSALISLEVQAWLASLVLSAILPDTTIVPTRRSQKPP